MSNYQDLFKRNAAWAAKNKASDKDFFSKLAEDQRPDYLFIACSDSRVSPELIMEANPGEFFVHRNVANQVAPGDLNVMSVLNFAILYLKVKHVVVYGHYGCGGVLAAVDNNDYKDLNPWLSRIKEIASDHAMELEALGDAELKHKRLVDLNVLEQCRNVKVSSVYKKAKELGEAPEVHGWVYDMEHGILKEV